MADGFQFAFTPAVEQDTAVAWEKVKRHVTPLEWRLHAPLIAEINRLKREKNAVILAHNYMTPEIFHGVGDFVGDSLALAREAARTDASVIVQAGVHFMAETSKILSPHKTVLIPSQDAGCSLASSITGASRSSTASTMRFSSTRAARSRRRPSGTSASSTAAASSGPMRRRSAAFRCSSCRTACTRAECPATPCASRTQTSALSAPRS